MLLLHVQCTSLCKFQRAVITAGNSNVPLWSALLIATLLLIVASVEGKGNRMTGPISGACLFCVREVWWLAAC